VKSPDLVVVGGGVIGLACAWRARQAGASVLLADDSLGRGASFAAAGMLAAVTEAHFGEEGLLELNLRSAAVWPGFKDELEAATGEDLAYRDDGTLAVAFDTGDRDALMELYRFQQELKLDSSWLTPSACRDIEPLIAPSIRGGLFVSCDHSVDPRRVVQALHAACEGTGVDVVAEAAAEVIVEQGRVAGVRLRDGDVVRAPQTLLAAGWEAGILPGLPTEARPPVRPVKGQIMRLKLPDGYPVPRHTVRAISQGTSLYVVVRPDGEIVCGATVEEMGADTRVTGGGVYALLRDAQLVLPMLLEAEFKEAIAGLRPGSPDNAPMIGLGAIDGLLVATGHYRNGILLAPITASLIAGLVHGGRGGSGAAGAGGGELPSWAAGFDPRRFERARLAT
jgi:glycine oxidase